LPTRVELCCHCAGEFDSPVELNSFLKAPDGPYSVVLPSCKMCFVNGCHITVRGARQNSQAKEDTLDAQAAREAGRRALVMASEEAATVAEASAIAPSKSRKRTTTKYILHYSVYVCMCVCVCKYTCLLILYCSTYCSIAINRQ
jgi:hypothetical protein